MRSKKVLILERNLGVRVLIQIVSGTRLLGPGWIREVGLEL